MTTVYLAGPYAARDLINGYATELRSMLIDVTSSWLSDTIAIAPGTLGAAADLTDDQARQHADTDLTEVANSDVLILITESVAGVPGTTGGRHVQTGIALGCGLEVVIVGEPENIFHRLSAKEGVHLVADWPAATRWIAAREAGDR